MTMDDIAVDLCVVGAGSAGLTAASIGAQLGRRVVLIERAAMGGECLNTGCVPSKALLACAKAVHGARGGGRFGLRLAEPQVDFAAVHRRVHEVIARIAPHDSVERFEGLGVQVLRAEARFVAPRVLVAGELRIRARRVVIATGSAPALPKIDGLDRTPYFTNETIFDIATLPDHLLIVGGGAIGIEMAQAFGRLGSRVTVVESDRALPRDDPELAGRLLKCLADEGIVIVEGAKLTRLRRSADGIVATLDQGGRRSELAGSHLLVAAGRRARVEGLDLERGGIRFGDDGIVVDAKLRTSAHGVYAAGDVVAKAPRFTHVAGYHAGIAVQNALVFPYARIRYETLPWVTFTDPELAQVGATEAEARKMHGADVHIVVFEFDDNDRAIAEGRPTGAVKVLARGNGSVLGASILGAHAGELAHVWVLAIGAGLKLKDVARMIAPYPTLGEASKSAASLFYKPKVFGSLARRVVGLFAHLP